MEKAYNLGQQQIHYTLWCIMTISFAMAILCIMQYVDIYNLE